MSPDFHTSISVFSNSICISVFGNSEVLYIRHLLLFMFFYIILRQDCYQFRLLLFFFQLLWPNCFQQPDHLQVPSTFLGTQGRFRQFLAKAISFHISAEPRLLRFSNPFSQDVIGHLACICQPTRVYQLSMLFDFYICVYLLHLNLIQF